MESWRSVNFQLVVDTKAFSVGIDQLKSCGENWLSTITYSEIFERAGHDGKPAKGVGHMYTTYT